MTQKQQTPSQPQTQATEEALSGNPAAGNLAQKAAATLESIMGSAMTTKLSELPTKEDRLNALADAIERNELVKEGIGFNMATWHGTCEELRGRFLTNGQISYQSHDQTGNQCGTVACLAGWADILENGKEIVGAPNARERGQKILGLDDHTAHELFHGQNALGDNLAGISPKRAIAVVRHLAKPGRVEWNSFDQSGNRIT